MGKISQKKVKQFLTDAAAANTAAAKGKIFEDLICYVIENVPGISVTKRNVLNAFNSEEIDVGVWNDKHRSGLAFLPNTFLIEAKNWSKPVGSSEVAFFVSKLESRGQTFGLFIALNGITGDATQINAAKDTIRQALGKKIQVVTISGQDLESFNSGKDLVQYIKEKLCELAASGTQFD
jgi:hypothetical protein